MKVVLRLLSVAVLFAAGGAFAAPVYVSVDNAPAYGGVEQRLLATDAQGKGVSNVRLEGAYYPNAEIEEIADLCQTGADGSCTWTPKYSGLVKIKAYDAQNQPLRVVGADEREGDYTVIGVRYSRIPPSALLMFVFAFVSLFGGLFWSMRLFLRAEG